GSKNCPPMLNKENYVPWSSRLIQYAKSRPNGKLILNSIINGPYVRRMIPEPGDPNRKVPVNEIFHVQTDYELTEKELKQIEADDQAIQTILLGLPKDIYAAVDSCETAQEICFENANQNSNGKGNLVAARVEGNATRHNAAAADLDEIEEVNANCILMANLQQASTSGTQTDKAPVYDSNGSAEVHNYEDCYDNEIFNMFTQEEQYTKLLEPIPKPHQVPQNDNNVIFEVFSVEQSGRIVEQHPANIEETPVLYDSLYNNLAIEVEKVNTVNRKLRETNAELTTELARYKNQEKFFEIKKSTVSSLLEEKKKLNSDFKIREDELLDKQIQLEKKIKELDNILVKTGQSIQTIHMLSPKPDSFYHIEQKMVLGYQNPFYLKQAQQKEQNLYDGKVLFEKHDPPVVHDSEKTLQLAQENDTTPSVARKFLNEVIQICLWCIDSGCSNHMTENLQLLINFVWKFLGTVRFENDHVAAILGFSDLQWGNILITMVYFVEGLGHNLFSVGQFCDSDLEVAFKRNACFIRNLEGVDLLSGNRTTNLYTINLHEIASVSPIFLMARATSTKSWFWHQRLSCLNFDTINDLAKNDLVTAIATACFTQNCSIIHRLFNKTPYELINGRKPDISFLYVFEALCYPKNDREDIGKLGAKGAIGFFIGYSADSCAFRVYNRRTKKIMETMNVTFDELSIMDFEQRSSKPRLQSMTSRQISSVVDLTYALSTITTQ
nr:integrase, catalytic region, zinc finger, CCHC-type, peptidase aspartic, catalytic [Tanacetum cinerariifolium]